MKTRKPSVFNRILYILNIIKLLESLVLSLWSLSHTVRNVANQKQSILRSIFTVRGGFRKLSKSEMELFVTVAYRWKDHCHFHWSLTVVAIVTKMFNFDERACWICHLRHLHYTNRLRFFEWNFCKLHYFTNIFASLFKPKLVLPPEVNIWEPKQDGER